MPCCSCFTVPYKRKVDDVFPPVDNDGLNQAALQQLTWYSLAHPDKLTKIGKFLSKRTIYYLTRRRERMVLIGIETFDHLLAACRANIPLFLPSYLRTINRVLETNSEELQIRATQSFEASVRYDDEMQNLHSLDFFVSKFSSMCYRREDSNTRICVHGLKGTRAIVRKIIANQRGVNLWSESHIEKIVPALLHNLSSSAPAQEDNASVHSEAGERESPEELATLTLQDLSSHASFGNLKTFLRPVFMYLDSFDKWSQEFSSKTFEVIMRSSQQQFSHVVVGELLHHLDKSAALPAEQKAVMIQVLSLCVGIAADGAIGPIGSVMEVFHSLLRNLRKSCDGASQTEEDEMYQSAIVRSFGKFSTHIPPTQQIEVLIFIISKLQAPLADIEVPSDSLNSKVNMMRCVLGVAETHHGKRLSEALPDALLTPLLTISTDSEAALRALAHSVLFELLECEAALDAFDGQPVQASKENIAFLKRCSRIHWFLHEAIASESQPNERENYAALLAVMHKLATYFEVEEMTDIVRLILSLQKSEDALRQGFVSAFFIKLGHARGCEELVQYATLLSNQSDRLRQCVLAHELPPECTLADTPMLSPTTETPTTKYELFEVSRIASMLQGVLPNFGDLEALLNEPYVHSDSGSVKPAVAPVLRVRQAGKRDRKPSAIAPNEIDFDTIKRTLASYPREQLNHLPVLVAQKGENVWSVVGNAGEREKRLKELLQPTAELTNPSTAVKHDIDSPFAVWNLRRPTLHLY
eukprot:m.120422 g.120422  ORF g.120422 m.120422 type:complete len:755 (+) comp9577_c0_seq2:171-2435(+)